MHTFISKCPASCHKVLSIPMITIKWLMVDQSGERGALLAVKPYIWVACRKNAYFKNFVVVIPKNGLAGRANLSFGVTPTIDPFAYTTDIPKEELVGLPLLVWPKILKEAFLWHMPHILTGTWAHTLSASHFCLLGKWSVKIAVRHLSMDKILWRLLGASLCMCLD